MDKGLIVFYILGTISVLGVCFAAYFAFIRYNFRGITWVMRVFLLFSCYMIFAQYLKYRSLHFYVDFSHWMQILYSISQTWKPTNLGVEIMVPGAVNYLSVHFVPFVYVPALFFKLWPYSATLIILNFLLMMSSAIPLYKLASTYRYRKQFPLFMMVLLLWYPTFQYTVLYEFEMLRFAIPIIFWMLYFWEKRKMSLYFFFVVLAALVREEVGLTVMMFGIYLSLFEKQRKAGIVTAVIGLGGFITITQIIMPALRTTGGYEHIAMGSFGTFGNTIGEIMINLIKHPVFLLRTIFQPIKLANAFMFFLPLLFVPFFAPAVLLTILANFGVGMLSESHTHISYMLYYLSPSIPFVFYAFIKGWAKFSALLVRTCRGLIYQTRNNGRHKCRPYGYLKRNLYNKFSGGSQAVEIEAPTRKNVDVNSVAMVTVFSALLVSNIFFGPSPISLQFWFKNLKPAPFRTQDFHYSVYKITAHHCKVEQFCKTIPDSAIVSAQHFLFPRLFKKRGTMIFPRLESVDGRFKADYAFFDKTNNGLKKGSPSYRTQSDFDLVEKNKDIWKLVKSDDGYFLYKRIMD